MHDGGRERVLLGRASKGEWCVETKRILLELGLRHVWETETVGDDKAWRSLVWMVIQEREEIRWRREMVGKSTLGRYVRVKDKLRAEWFFDKPRVWVRRWVGLRAGVTCLEETEGRYVGVDRARRVCRWCKNGDVEDVDNFPDNCKWWGSTRTELWNTIRNSDRLMVKRVEAWGTQERVDWMLRGGCSVRTRSTLMGGVGGWLLCRERMRRSS